MEGSCGHKTNALYSDPEGIMNCWSCSNKLWNLQDKPQQGGDQHQSI